jgi:uncharacterized repeat protein (TIGR03837 family)
MACNHSKFSYNLHHQIKINKKITIQHHGYHLNQFTCSDYDIFCTVIDNYGDIATCWRLALQLNQRHGIRVRLWVDDLLALHQLVPETKLYEDQQWIEAIHVCHWKTPFHFDRAAKLVIEAFACELPTNYRQAMLKQASLCVNLEYFSCEDWVLGCHGLRSFQSDGLHKYFFFPGIVSGTGGVLYEADYEQQRLAFTLNKQVDWFKHWQLARAHASSVRISLFGYENKAIISLLEQAALYPVHIEFYCPMSKLCLELVQHFDQWQVSAGNSYTLGNATIHFIPFLPQSEYDQLLWSCDLNFVRGEESLIRGLLSAKPLVWHIYPTEDQAHWIKLDAFMDRIAMPSELTKLNNDWNAQTQLANLTEVLKRLPQLQRHAQDTQESILSLGDLSTNLVSFIEKKYNNIN